MCRRCDGVNRLTPAWADGRTYSCHAPVVGLPSIDEAEAAWDAGAAADLATILRASEKAKAAGWTITA